MFEEIFPMNLLIEQPGILICLSWIILTASIIGCYFYPKLALKCGAVAIPNSRNLHSRIIPRGAGIMIVICVLSSLLILSFIRTINFHTYLPILIGGFVISIVGFADDCLELSARLRMFVQLIIAIWLYFWFADGANLNIGFVLINIGWLKFPITIFLLLWFYNLFNFIDGSDGMASSAVIYISTVFSIIWFIEHQQMLLLLLTLLGSATLGFIVFNWPPAKIFLGDVGTSFCSYIISVVIMISIWQEHFNILVWLIALGYYLSDTTFTTFIRIIKFPKTWYYPHRSHAYQNLARIRGHLKILLLVWGFNLLWFLPLAILAYVFPKYSMLYFVIAYVGILPFLVKHGPLSKE
jgi:Fuc2NAc and GlcNAc transferase